MSTSARHYCSSTTKLPAYTKLVLTTISKNLLLSYHRLAAPHGLEPIISLLTYLLTYLLTLPQAGGASRPRADRDAISLLNYLLTYYLTLLTPPYFTYPGWRRPMASNR